MVNECFDECFKVSATGLVIGVGSESGMITVTSTVDVTKSGIITIIVSSDNTTSSNISENRYILSY